MTLRHRVVGAQAFAEIVMEAGEDPSSFSATLPEDGADDPYALVVELPDEAGPIIEVAPLPRHLGRGQMSPPLNQVEPLSMRAMAAFSGF
ncbi:MAG: hypothetical protein ACE366_23390 [Bradymonadia bacterium]